MENDEIEDGIFDCLKISLIDAVNDSSYYDVRSRTRFALWSNTMNTVQDMIWSSIWESVGDIITKEK